ncbi:tail fiber protein [Fusibacter paucivorans]|uniref:Tail fiber protein n=1 Tax=Fusibacter paucivorans TaxID=76009 RepID=A0ABS5PP51_9FIRM|nr:tail fiber protein [Fusibacter paucivorans]MBS7526940.1 tail fiber protein [Fusibacter paucivorans]
MSKSNQDSHVGEIKIFAGTYAPKNWEFCDGQMLSKEKYRALYELIGTTYGSDDDSTFALPNLRGRVPVNKGAAPGLSTYQLGQKRGEASVRLEEQHLPNHTHKFYVSTLAATDKNPQNLLIANSNINLYKDAKLSETRVAMASETISETGEDKPHTNLQPFTSIGYIICVKEETSTGDDAGSDAVLMDQFIGEVRAFPYYGVPKGWLRCNGKSWEINKYTALYSIIYEQFGGKSHIEFNVPNINERIVIHRNDDFPVGAMGGTEKVSISTSEMPKHTHSLRAIDAVANENLCDTEYMIARANYPDSRNLKVFCRQKENLVAMEAAAIRATGEASAHDNVMPSISIQYCIAYEGTYPPRE